MTNVNAYGGEIENNLDVRNVTVRWPIGQPTEQRGQRYAALEAGHHRESRRYTVVLRQTHIDYRPDGSRTEAFNLTGRAVRLLTVPTSRYSYARLQTVLNEARAKLQALLAAGDEQVCQMFATLELPDREFVERALAGEFGPDAADMACEVTLTAEESSTDEDVAGFATRIREMIADADLVCRARAGMLVGIAVDAVTRFEQDAQDRGELVDEAELAEFVRGLADAPF